MKKGKLEFKSGRSLKGTPCIPQGSSKELSKMPDGALGYNNKTGDLLLKTQKQLIKVGSGGVPQPEPEPEPPEPPQPDPDALILRLTMVNEDACELAIMIEKGGITESSFVDASGNPLSDDDIIFEWNDEYADAYIVYVNPDSYDSGRGPITATFKGDMHCQSEMYLFDGYGVSLDIVSFGGVYGYETDNFDVGTVHLIEIQNTDSMGLHAIESWQGLENCDALMLGGYMEGEDFPIQSLPASLARLSHLKVFIATGLKITNSALYGYSEFAKNKLAVAFNHNATWTGNVKKFADALAAEGYSHTEDFQYECGFVFEADISAKGYGDLVPPYGPGGMYIVDVTGPLLWAKYMAGEPIEVNDIDGYFSKMPIYIVGATEYEEGALWRSITARAGEYILSQEWEVGQEGQQGPGFIYNPPDVAELFNIPSNCLNLMIETKLLDRITYFGNVYMYVGREDGIYGWTFARTYINKSGDVVYERIRIKYVSHEYDIDSKRLATVDE